MCYTLKRKRTVPSPIHGGERHGNCLYMETYLEEFPTERNAMLQYEFYIMDMMEKG